jgi:hypothetical protein
LLTAGTAQNRPHRRKKALSMHKAEKSLNRVSSPQN